jgi:hypothetical protein
LGKVVLDISMSLGGFITARNDSHEQPLGEGGMRLHDWTRNTSEDLMQGGTSATIGAIAGVTQGGRIPIMCNLLFEIVILEKRACQKLS